MPEESNGGLTDEERDAAAAHLGIFPYKEPVAAPSPTPALPGAGQNVTTQPT